MPSRQARTPPRRPISELCPDTQRTERLPPGPDLGDEDTVAVPLSSAETLPCPRLAPEELATLPIAPTELAALVRLTREPPALPVRESDPGPTRPLTRLPPALAPRPAPVQPRPASAPRPGSTRPLPASASRPAPIQPRPAVAPRPGSPRPLSALPRPAPAHRDSSAPTGPGSGGALMPTQLWLGPRSPSPAAATAGAARPGRRTPRSLWAWLWSLLGFPASPGNRPLPRLLRR